MQKMTKKTSALTFDPTCKPKGMKRLVLAWQNSLKALLWVVRNEAAFRQELVVLFASLIVLSVWRIPLLEKALLLSSVLFVLFAEIINTALEVTIDRIGREVHPLSGLAKDLGSAGVLLAMVVASVLWLTIIVSTTGSEEFQEYNLLKETSDRDK
ncbi:diacylglycerol kinase [Alteromonas pelagimontana]|uniref:Diacylglycerol kinase n=1 Tax=Alteromonas pelagimontana TaxID=1858656 RepID=A0A6M4MEF0_9ALTE|nr:diacylglycerol kinase [Alteromonas pelagimontana]QJR81482.1 diacylglycerol kinase [Alteromonas pelagimontana]